MGFQSDVRGSPNQAAAPGHTECADTKPQLALSEEPQKNQRYHLPRKLRVYFVGPIRQIAGPKSLNRSRRNKRSRRHEHPAERTRHVHKMSAR